MAKLTKHNSPEPEHINFFIAKNIIYKYNIQIFFFNLCNFESVYYYSYLINCIMVSVLKRKFVS